MSTHPLTSTHIDTGLTQGPVDVAALTWPEACGAEAIFLGRTRCETHPQFGPLVRLEYEAYGPMAGTLLRQMAEDAVAKWGCQAVRIAHAQGVVEPGQASVVIQVATPHRGEAFAASRYIIDRIKHELPIWKREIWERGETFVQGCCAHRHDDGGDSDRPSSNDAHHREQPR